MEEEQALYRAILAAPHDDTPRLVYADWLEENAGRFDEVRANAERRRAEFIRLQCELARSAERDPELVKRERRLLFTTGPKWRRELGPFLLSSRFDRGFLRPFRSLPPMHLLTARHLGFGDHSLFGPTLPEQARRYHDGNDYFSLCPLWDVHLYASTWWGDRMADHGGYGELLMQVAESPSLERVGWLKVSFLRTPAAEFLRQGNFPNVETLVLNCGPFPEVLEAVAENESFRSLRYVQFGTDGWAWAARGSRAWNHLITLAPKIDDTNRKHLPYGEMRGELKRILADTPPLSPPTPIPLPLPKPLPELAALLNRLESRRQHTSEGAGAGIGLAIAGVLFGIFFAATRDDRPQTTPQRLNTPEIPKFDPDLFKPLPNLLPDPETMRMLEELGKPRPKELFGLPGFPKFGEGPDELPVAPPPREKKE